jgi:FtsP/CotA-like multicopper oxidase with cupredoxin domain
MMAAIGQGCDNLPDADVSQNVGAIGPISGTEMHLDPTTVPKFAQQLAIPEVWTPTAITSNGKVIRNQYSLSVTQSTAQMLPPGLPATTVLAYSGMAAPKGSSTSATLTVSPGAVFENTVGIPTRITWTDAITTPAFLEVDPGLHFSNPNFMNKPVPPFVLFPPGYQDSLFPVAHVTHTHGLVVGPDQDGTAEEWFTAPHSIEGPSQVTNVYNMPNQQAPTQLFYHDHVMGVTRIGLYSGVVGTAYFIRDPSNPLDAPTSPLPTGQFEIPLALTTRGFYTDGNLDFPPDRGTLNTGNDAPPNLAYWSYNEGADEVLVNGKVWPNLNVQRRQYRFRVLAGSNTQLFDLQLCNGTIVDSADATTASCSGTVVPFVVIGSDGGYLPAPQTVTDVQIGITERTDILIDFSKFAAGTKIKLMNAKGIGGRPAGTLSNVMQFTVQSGTAVTPPTLNPALFPARPALTTNAPTRFKVLHAFDDDDINSNSFNKRSIDGMGFDTPPTEFALVGSTEEWDLINAHDPIDGDPDLNTHQIHIHLLEFQVLNRQPIDPNAYRNEWALLNGHEPVSRPIVVSPSPFFTGSAIPPTPYETGWKDTVQAPGGFVTRILVRWAPQSVPAGGVSPGQNLFPIDPTSFPDPIAGPGYVWHCHLVGHEDHDMMRPLVIVNAWAAGKSYKVGTVVAFNNIDYRVTTAHTSVAGQTPDMRFDLWDRANNNDGSWQPQIRYAANDRVTWNSGLFVALSTFQAQAGQVPGSNPTLWRQLPRAACAELAQLCEGQTSTIGAQCLADGQAAVHDVCQNELSVCMSDCETTKARPCSGLCNNPIVFSVPDFGTFNSPVLGTGDTCFETTSALKIGTNSNFASGRSLTVNQRLEPLNGNWASPIPGNNNHMPPLRNEGYCIQVSAGASGASFQVKAGG